MKIWFSSDHHFNHKNILEYSSRPFSSIEEMNEALIENWNKNISIKDHVYYLGDFFFAKPDFINKTLNRLNGKIILIKGNHDHLWLKKISHSKIVSAHDYLELKIKDKNLVLMHYPIEYWNKKHYGSIHLHGHSHGKSRKVENRIDVGVDCNNYTPININEIIL